MTLERGSIDGITLTCCAGLELGQFPPKTISKQHWKRERERDRYQRSVTEVESLDGSLGRSSLPINILCTTTGPGIIKILISDSKCSHQIKHRLIRQLFVSRLLLYSPNTEANGTSRANYTVDVKS